MTLLLVLFLMLFGSFVSGYVLRGHSSKEDSDA